MNWSNKMKKKNRKATHDLTMGLNKKICPRSKRSQEEMVGFGVIVGLVAVILLIFLYFAISGKSKDNLDDYKAKSFLQSAMNYNTNCDGVRELNLSVEKLIGECEANRNCVNGLNSCEVLTTTMNALLEKGWQGEGEISGYSLNITEEGREVISLQKGNNTGNSRGTLFPTSRYGSLIEVKFKIYITD